MSKFIPNSFQLPNAFVDQLLGELSGNAVKCYLLIARKTTGWQKESDFISVSQFMEFCQIKDRKTVYKVLAELEEVGLIRSQKNSGATTEFFLVRELPEREHTVENSTKNPHQYQKSPLVGKNGTAPVPKNHTTTSTKNWDTTKYNNLNTANNTPLNPPEGESSSAETVLNYLNSALATLATQLGERKPMGYSLKPWAKNITARVRESSVEDCCQVVDYLIAKWGRDSKMREYLCPKTIFRQSNFADYLPKSTAWTDRGKPVCVNGKWLAPSELEKHLLMPTVDEVRALFQKSLSGNPFKVLDFSNKRNLVLYHATIATKNKRPLERDLPMIISQEIKNAVERIHQLRVPTFS